MQRTITVKGTGRVKKAVDYIIISMTMDSRARNYEETMNTAAKKIDLLNSALEKTGFDKNSVKTTNFNVYTDYINERDKKGNYNRVFNGYICSHSLKLEFDFDTARLAEALCSISICLAQPELSVKFTVKDPSEIGDELLRDATKNARQKAQILCEASGVKLGELVNINYNWGTLNVVSRTNYSVEDRFLATPSKAMANIDITPDDINVSDSATFVWEIK